MTLTDVATKMFKTVKLLAHPVGSIYMSTESTSPVELFGGTWEQITDTFLWCAGTSHAAGTTGGEETHTLTVAEMPSHSHTYGTLPRQWAEWDDSVSIRLIQASQKTGKEVNKTTNSTGGSSAHNNMPPYLSVYAWKRTA